MFYRILWTAIIGMLMIVPLHAERKKANLQEDFARKKVTDSQAELAAEARIDVDHDNGLNCKAAVLNSRRMAKSKVSHLTMIMKDTMAFG